MKKNASLLAALLLLPVLLSSCNRDETQKEQEQADIPRSTIFSRTELPLPDGWECDSFPAMTCSGDTVTVDVRRPVSVDEDGRETYEFSTAMFRRDGTLLSIAGYPEYGAGTGDTDAVSLAPGNADAVLAAVFSPGNGTFAAEEVLSTEYEYTVLANLYDEDGELLFSVSPAEIQGYDLSRDVGNLTGDVFSVENILSYPAGEETAYCILTTEGLCAVSETGETLWSYGNTSDTPTALIAAGERLLYLYQNKNGEQLLCVLDTDAGKPGARVTIPESLAASGSVKLYAGKGYDIYVRNNSGLYGMDLVTDAEGVLMGEAVPVTDFLSSGIAYHDIHSLCIIDDTAFMTAETDFFDDVTVNTLYLHTMLSVDALADKEEIVIAGLCGNFYLQYLIRDFNASSEDYRLVLRDYTKYDDVETRKLAFDTDLAAGALPDIVLLADTDAYSNNNVTDTTVETYANAGIFCDLTPHLRADADFRYDNLLSYVTKPYQDENGKQVLFPMSGMQSMIVARKDEIIAPQTAEEFLSFAESLTDDAPLFFWGQTEYVALSAAVEERFDTETAVCTFDDGTLESLIDRAKAVAADRANDNYDAKASELFTGGDLHFLTDVTFSGLWDFVEQTDNWGGRDTVSFVGFPNADGELCMGDVNQSYFAVMETSAHKAVCVDILQAYLEMVTRVDFSLLTECPAFYSSDIDAQIAFLEDKTVILENRSTRLVDDEEADLYSGSGKKYKVTAEDAEAYRAYLDSIVSRVDGNRTPVILFWEEYRANPDRTTAEMLDVLTSRVSIYLSEQLD
ncbi:MAG: hypothetical protein IJ449_02615 [Clostridia bacterium]|nr:hypothetical protein [Clostridia bacterium]